MGGHALHMTGVSQQETLFDGITCNGVVTLNLESYGLKKDCRAGMVILQAASKTEAMRLRPARLFVIRKGRVISTSPETCARVTLGSETVDVDFCPVNYFIS